jgi:hypothetical protein
MALGTWETSYPSFPNFGDNIISKLLREEKELCLGVLEFDLSSLNQEIAVQWLIF